MLNRPHNQGVCKIEARPVSEFNKVMDSISKAESMTKDTEDINPYLEQIKRTFTDLIMPDIKKETMKSTKIGIIATFFVGVLSIVLSLFGSYFLMETSKKASVEIEKLQNKASTQIAEARRTPVSTITWMDDAEATAAFGPPSKLDDLRKELGKDLPFDCRPPKTDRYRELAREVTAVGSFSPDEQKLLKAALFFCNRDYQKASIYLNGINEPSLARDRDWLKLHILAESSKWDEIQKLLSNLLSSKGSWFGIDEQRIQKTLKDIGNHYQEHQKQKIKICAYDGSAGTHKIMRSEEGNKLCQILDFLGWNCEIRSLDYNKYSKYLGRISRGLSTQITRYNDDRIWSDLLADLSLIPAFGEVVRKSPYIESTDKQWVYMDKLLEDCSNADIAIIIGTEFGGVYEKIETLEDFKKHSNISRKIN